jgi:hypothetical protein
MVKKVYETPSEWIKSWIWWYESIIPATWDAENRRITIQVLLGQKCKTQYPNSQSKK